MFLATRDLRFAKGRFALIGGVIALITLLVVMLTGLSAGLARESISAIDTLGKHGVSQVGFSKPVAGQKVGYESSSVTAQQVEKAQKDGVKASPLTIASANSKMGDKMAAVSVFALPAGSFALPHGVSSGQVVVGSGLAKDADVKAGDELTIGGAHVKVVRLSDDASYQHTPVVWMTTSDAAKTGVPQRPNVVLLSGAKATETAKAADLDTMTPHDSLSAISSYQAENGSLTLMRGMLLFVSALVVGAFFTVWTIQRSPDLAVLKAIGAKTSYLVRDALGQASILLIVGGGIGTAIAAVAGSFAKEAVPFVVNLNTTVVPLALLFALGLAGAAMSLRRIVTVDPMNALGSAR